MNHCCIAYNTFVNKLIGFPPDELVNEREPKVSSDILRNI